MVRRSPLALAAVLALVPAAALAVMLSPLHHTAPTSPTANRAPAPTATGTPARTPAPAPLPPLALPDRFDLTAPRAFGRIDVSGFEHYHDIDISGYALAATPTSLPAELPVWTLRGFAPGADIGAVFARMGIDTRATPAMPGSDPGWRALPDAGQLAAGISDTTVISTGITVSSSSFATAAASQALQSVGLLPQHAEATATSYQEGTTVWRVDYRRRPIDGVPVGFGSFTDSVAMLSVDPYGNTSRVSFDEPSVDGGAQYPLRSWREAWSEVARGHWFDECCWVNTGGGGPPHPIAFRADSVSLAYEQVGSGAGLLVPMYVFADSRSQVSLAVPALRLADLSEPGGFRVTTPGGG